MNSYPPPAPGLDDPGLAAYQRLARDHIRDTDLPGPIRRAIADRLEAMIAATEAGHAYQDGRYAVRLPYVVLSMPTRDPVSGDLGERVLAISDRIRARLADDQHAHLCMCDGWPSTCQHYTPGDLAETYTGVEVTVFALASMGLLGAFAPAPEVAEQASSPIVAELEAQAARVRATIADGTVFSALEREAIAATAASLEARARELRESETSR